MEKIFIPTDIEFYYVEKDEPKTFFLSPDTIDKVEELSKKFMQEIFTLTFPEEDIPSEYGVNMTYLKTDKKTTFNNNSTNFLAELIQESADKVILNYYTIDLSIMNKSNSNQTS